MNAQLTTAPAITHDHDGTVLTVTIQDAPEDVFLLMSMAASYVYNQGAGILTQVGSTRHEDGSADVKFRF